ncbi:hypothetical protein ElyMa_004941900 [Elysia marginata]|uniref:Uncharacterized protein n=1 Tax=Elysia marginata TaxID=1093978 RepID=A0AAV4J0C0_9GAST|nr:hypothetical protein ElyMa_004941900 [Elysia marginata]
MSKKKKKKMMMKNKKKKKKEEEEEEEEEEDKKKKKKRKADGEDAEKERDYRERDFTFYPPRCSPLRVYSTVSSTRKICGTCSIKSGRPASTVHAVFARASFNPIRYRHSPNLDKNQPHPDL